MRSRFLLALAVIGTAGAMAACGLATNGTDAFPDGGSGAVTDAGNPDGGEKIVCYRDADGDGYPSAAPADSITVSGGSCPTGYIPARTDGKWDCNDANAAVHPGAPEVCGDGLDNDCDGKIDDGCSSSTTTCYPDKDGDGYPASSGSLEVVGSVCPTGYMPARTDGKWDCNDADPTIHPGAVEICDGKDDNCDGQIDENYFVGTPCKGHLGVCKQYTGVVECADATHIRCSVDAGGSQSKATAEICGNGLDDDCDGVVDNGCPAPPPPSVTTTCYPDADGDGYPASSGSVDVAGSTCPSGYIVARSDGKWDCNDADPTIHPGAVEICDGKDDNCDGQIDEGFRIGAACTGNFGICAKATGVIECASPTTVRCSVDVGGSQSVAVPEICGNGLDDDCDGVVDNGCPAPPPTVTDGFTYTAPSGVIVSYRVMACADSSCVNGTTLVDRLLYSSSSLTFANTVAKGTGGGTRYYRVNIDMAAAAGDPPTSWGCMGNGILLGSFVDASQGSKLVAANGVFPNGVGGCENVSEFQDL